MIYCRTTPLDGPLAQTWPAQNAPTEPANLGPTLGHVGGALPLAAPGNPSRQWLRRPLGARGNWQRGGGHWVMGLNRTLERIKIPPHRSTGPEPVPQRPTAETDVDFPKRASQPARSRRIAASHGDRPGCWPTKHRWFPELQPQLPDFARHMPPQLLQANATPEGRLLGRAAGISPAAGRASAPVRDMGRARCWTTRCFVTRPVWLGGP